jgi:hypothetical protein
MFSYCKIKDKICPLATESTYDPEHEDYLWETYTFCGAMSGVDTRINSLSKCWLDMTNGQRTKHVKKLNSKILIKRGYHYDKVRKRWVRT